MTSSRDVALRAGVSRSTVSQILNGHGHRFTPETVARVTAAAEGLGYRPSAAARTLARGTSDLVITLVPNITFGPRLREFLDVLTRELEQEGYTNLIRVATTTESLKDAILELRPRAVVSLAPLENTDRARLERHGVLVVEQPSALQKHIDVAIGQQQAKHLASRGYQMIAVAVPIDVREHRFAPPRTSGVHEWSLNNRLQILPSLHVDLSQGSPIETVRNLPGGAIGVAAYNDEMALAILSSAQQLKLNVPEDLGIIGVDNSILARITTPTITTIDFDLEFSARQIFLAIVDSGPELQGSAATEVEARLRVIQGGSTARAGIDEPPVPS